MLEFKNNHLYIDGEIIRPTMYKYGHVPHNQLLTFLNIDTVIHMYNDVTTMTKRTGTVVLDKGYGTYTDFDSIMVYPHRLYNAIKYEKYSYVVDRENGRFAFLIDGDVIIIAELEDTMECTIDNLLVVFSVNDGLYINGIKVEDRFATLAIKDAKLKIFV